MITNFSQAWVDFRKSTEYRNAWESMKAKGFKQRYANNVLWVAFSAGWADRKIFILKDKPKSNDHN